MDKRLNLKARSWDALKAELSALAVEHGESAEAVRAALDRGGALPNLIAKLAGIERPKKKPGPSTDRTRSDLLMATEDWGRANGLRGERLAMFVNRHVDGSGELFSAGRTPSHGASMKKLQRARRRLRKLDIFA